MSRRRPLSNTVARVHRRVSKRTRGFIRPLPKRIRRARRYAVRLYNMRYRVTYKASLARIPARDELPALLNRRGLVGTGAEIGVKTGKHSDWLLSRWQGALLISVDPWLEAVDEYVDRANVEQGRHDLFHEQTVERLRRHGGRSEIWRLTSVEAARRVAVSALDFVYIDARHDYDSVLEDLEAWFPKVRPGGIVAGHDYVDGEFPSGRFGVRSAVDEFFAARGIRVYCTNGPSPVELFPSWIAAVPVEPRRPSSAAPDGSVGAPGVNRSAG